MDILSSSENDDAIAWYENNGAANPTLQCRYTTSADGAWSVKAADIDADGDLDIVSASFNDGLSLGMKMMVLMIRHGQQLILPQLQMVQEQ